MSYILVDTTTRTVINVITWDGVTAYTPPVGVEVIAYAGPVWIGGAWDGLSCSNPTPPSNPVPATPGALVAL